MKAAKTRKDVTKLLNNKTMNGDTYAERRRVMAWVYRARDLLDEVGYRMPRVQIRVCEESERVMGVGRMNGDAIWISASAIHGYTEDQLGFVVLHELGHAVFGADHREDCPLMRPIVPCASHVRIRAVEQVFKALAN